MSEVFTLDALDKAIESARSGGTTIKPIERDGRSYYAMTIPRSTLAFMVMIYAKAEWKARYRAERIAKWMQS